MIRTMSLVSIVVASITLPARAQAPTRQGTPAESLGRTHLGQTLGGEAITGRGQSAVPDALFAAAAGSGGLAELNVSQIGFQRATDPQLKQFSQRMIDDHTKLNQQLMNVVTRKGIRVPETIDARAQFCAESLAGLSGEKFDECYAMAQLVIHMDALAMFEAEAHRGQDPDIRAVAASALPIIKEHLKTIKPIAMRYEKEKDKNEDNSAVRAGRIGGNR